MAKYEYQKVFYWPVEMGWDNPESMLEAINRIALDGWRLVTIQEMDDHSVIWFERLNG